MDYSSPGSSVHGILQARIQEQVAISFSRGSSRPRNWTWVTHITGRFFYHWAAREAKMFINHYLTYCNPFWEPTWVTHMLMSVWYEIDWQGPFQGSNRHPNHCIFLPFFPWASATIHMHFHSSLSCIVLIILFYYCELYIGRSQA